jgi:hypothetical protein
LIGVGKKRCISLNFIRESSSAYEAIASAITEIKRALPDATLLEVTPDSVGLTDAAQILGCSRQNIRNLMVKTEKRSPIRSVNLEFLRTHQIYSLDSDVLYAIAQKEEKDMGFRFRILIATEALAEITPLFKGG